MRKYLPYLLALGIVAGFIAYYWYTKPPDTVIMKQTDLQNVAQLQDSLNISKSEAQELKKEIAKVSTRPPATSYTVQAETVSDAAKIVSKQIKDDTVPVALPSADKTIITPNAEAQKVDVYRINLRKDNGIGVYASTESFGAIAQHKNVIVFGGPKYDGGYEIGAGYMIRW